MIITYESEKNTQLLSPSITLLCISTICLSIPI